MPRTVLDYPVEIIPGCPEPNLLELITRYYYQHLPHDEALAASLEYVHQIQLAEGWLKVSFAKYVLSKGNLPEGVSLDEFVQGAAENVRAEQTAEKAVAAEEEQTIDFDNDPEAEAVKVECLVFNSPAEMDAFLQKLTKSHRPAEQE